jgi:hypothetical protein
MAARAAAAHEHVLARQSTVDFIGSLLKGTDTPDEPLPLLFDGVPQSESAFASLARAAAGGRDPPTPSPSLNPLAHGGLVAGGGSQAKASVETGEAASGATRVGAGVATGANPAANPGAHHANANSHPQPHPPRRHHSRDATTVRADGQHIAGSKRPAVNGAGASDHGKRPRRIPSASEVDAARLGDANPPRVDSLGSLRAAAPPTNANADDDDDDASAKTKTEPAAARIDVTFPPPSTPKNTAAATASTAATTTTTTTSAEGKAKTKNPKRADRRRTIARFTTAILRAGGSNAFIARDGLGYRKAFDRFLVETYGETFSEGGYWYENARVEPFFRVMFYIATSGRVQLDHDEVNALFCKREKRQAAEWLLNEEELSKYGITATQLAQTFEGPPSCSASGYPRGTPLIVPTDVELDAGNIPSAAAAAAAANAAAAARQAAHQQSGGRGGDAAGGCGGVDEKYRTHGAAGPARAPQHSGDPYATPGPGGGVSQHGGHFPVAQAYHPHHVAAHAAAAAHAAQYGGGHHAMKSQQQHGGPPGHGPGGVPMMHGGGGMMYGQPLPYGMYPGAYGPGGMGPGPDGMMMGPGGPGGPMGGPHGGPGMYAHHGGPGPFVGHAAMHDARAPHPGTVPHHAGGHHAGGHAAAGGSGPRRQYSSDLSRLMSEFNNNPGSSDDFLKSFLQRTASELDFMAQGQDSSGGTKSQGS